MRDQLGDSKFARGNVRKKSWYAIWCAVVRRRVWTPFELSTAQLFPILFLPTLFLRIFWFRFRSWYSIVMLTSLKTLVKYWPDDSNYNRCRREEFVVRVWRISNPNFCKNGKRCEKLVWALKLSEELKKFRSRARERLFSHKQRHFLW